MGNGRIAPKVLEGRTALVTGSSRGIGRAIAQRFAAAGARVIVTGRSLDTAASIEREGRAEAMTGTLAETVALIRSMGAEAIALAADLDNPSERDHLVERASEAAGADIDILVNNAGVAENAAIEQASLALFDRTVEYYLRVPFVLSKAAIPGMRRLGAGWIINVGSANGLPPHRPFSSIQWTLYGAVKSALTRLSQGLAAELLDANIAVNVVAPSTAITTPGSERYMMGCPSEDVSYLAQTALALAHLPARERTGLVAHSMHFPAHYGIDVFSLDGRDLLPPPLAPALSHPRIEPSGFQ